MSELRASIDIGSNSVLLLVAEVHNGKINREIYNESRVTGLGRGIDKTGAFYEEAMGETKAALSEYSRLIIEQNIDPKKVIVTATEASRVAKNSGEFFDLVHTETGLQVTTISGEGEAYYTARGVLIGGDWKSDSVSIMDIGGASTELIKVRTTPFEITSTISLPIGSVRATEYLSNDIFDEKLSQLKTEYPIENYETNTLVCVAGSMTSIAGMIKGIKKYKDSEVNGYSFNFQKFNSLLSKFQKSKVEELLYKFPFLGKRARTIMAGARVGVELGQILGVEEFFISTYGLRYGTIVEGEVDGRFRQ